ASVGKAYSDYTKYLDSAALRGPRIGVARERFKLNRLVDPVMDAALAAMKREGAELVDPVKLPSSQDLGGGDYQVMLYEFKAGLNAYFASLGSGAPVKSMQELIDFNERNRDRELKFFGQETLIEAQAKGPLTDKAYLDAKEKCVKWSQGIDAMMDE